MVSTVTTSSSEEPHRPRQLAESFGTDPERYDRTRQRYPHQMVDAIVAAIPGPEILDVGMGTGIAAHQFQAAGCKVLGVKVDDRMAEYARTGGLSSRWRSSKTGSRRGGRSMAWADGG